MAKKHDENDIKSYKLRRLKKDLPENSVVYVYNKGTKSVDGFVTDRDGKPVPFSNADIDLTDIVYQGINQIEIVDGKLRVRKIQSEDNYIKVTESDDFLYIGLDDTTIEKLANKQNNLDPDGTGTKYPTVDAVNIAISDIRQKIDEVVNDIVDIDVILDELQPQDYHFSNSTTVNVVHGLGKYPRVTVLVGSEEVEADISHTPDKNSLTVSFSRPYTGIVIVQ